MFIFIKKTIKAILRPFVQPLLVRIRLLMQTELARIQMGLAVVQDETRVAWLEAEKAKEYAKAAVFNQIALSMENKEGLSVSLPYIADDWVDRNGNLAKKMRFPILFGSDKGSFLLHPGHKANRHDKRVFVSTLSKTGTHFIDGILNELGFQQIPFFATSNACAVTIQGKQFFGNLPFYIQEKMVLPGQYMMGHVHGEYLHGLAGKDELLLSIRDLRYMLVSIERFMKGIKLEEVTPQYLIDRIHGKKGNIFQEVLYRAQSFLPLLGRAPVLRFEELIAEDRQKAWPSIEALAQVTGCTSEEVFAARDKNLRTTSTNRVTQMTTYTGRFSVLEGIWTLEVEKAFIAAGGDIINEQMGYSKSYNVD
jgi:hypothetical protein